MKRILFIGAVICGLWLAVAAMVDDELASGQVISATAPAAAIERSTPQAVSVTEEAKDVPDSVYNATLLVESDLSWSVIPANCKSVYDGGSWFVACRNTDWPSNFVIYGVIPFGSDFKLTAITGKAKDYALQGRMRKLPIITSENITDVNIGAIMSKYDSQR